MLFVSSLAFALQWVFILHSKARGGKEEGTEENGKKNGYIILVWALYEKEGERKGREILFLSLLLNILFILMLLFLYNTT